MGIIEKTSAVSYIFIGFIIVLIAWILINWRTNKYVPELTKEYKELMNKIGISNPLDLPPKKVTLLSGKTKKEIEPRLL